MSAQSSKAASLLYKCLAVFAAVRIDTLFVLLLAQLLAVRYILAPENTWLEHLSNANLLMLILAILLVVAAGYVINNFYDAEKDKINRPQKYLVGQGVPPAFQLFIYGVFNALALFFAFIVSARTLPFFGSYIFGIWLYSHVLKKTFWASNLFASLLAIIPFFALSLYFQNFSLLVLNHAAFLFLVILIRDLIKDLKNFRGDYVRKYSTTAVQFGLKATKWIITALIGLTYIPIYFLLTKERTLGAMHYYFEGSTLFLFMVLILLWLSQTQKMYLWLHNLLKLLIIAGVLSIILVRYPA